MTDSTSIYEKFTKDVVTIAIAQLILPLSGLIVLPLISKLLGAAAYGTYVQVYVTLSLISTFSSLGIGFAFIRFFAGETSKERIRQGFFSILVVEFGWSCLIALIFFLLAAPVAERFFDGATNIVYLSALILPFFTVNSHFFFFFRAFRQMKTLAVLQLAQGFGQVAILVALVLAGWGIFGAVLAMLIAYILSELAMFLLIVRQIGLGLPSFASFAKIKEYLRFGLPLLPTNLAGWITNLSDRYVIAAFWGIASTGIYAAAYNLGHWVIIYLGPLNLVLTPTLANLYDNNQIQDVKRHLTYSLKYFLLLAIPSAVGVSLLAKPMLQVLATAEFASRGPIVVPFVAAGMLLVGCHAIVTQPIHLLKKTGIFAIAWGIAAALNLGLNLLLVPRFGIVAAAITTLLSVAVASGLVSYVSFKYFRFGVDWVFILKSLLATGVMSAVVLLLNPTGLSNLLVAIVAGALVYFMVIYLLKGISKQEILFFRRLAVSLMPFGKSKLAESSKAKENE